MISETVVYSRSGKQICSEFTHKVIFYAVSGLIFTNYLICNILDQTGLSTNFSISITTYVCPMIFTFTDTILLGLAVYRI